MAATRRGFLLTLAAAAAGACSHGSVPIGGSLPQLLPRSKGRRVVVVGGGWGGLSAARHLRAAAPDLEVVLIERNDRFWSCPLSNQWLANLLDTRMLVHDYAVAARKYGYTFIQAEVSALERDARRVRTPRGALDYDWLVLAVGIRYHYEAWYGDDRHAADYTQRHYPCAFMPGAELMALKQKLERFAGGDLVMTVPPLPYRCPPAPYERAAMIAWLLKSRRLKGRLIVLDANPYVAGFRATLMERYPAQVTYVPQVQITAVDPFNRIIATDLGQTRFDDAILIPPQQAGDLLWQAGLIGRQADGTPTGWGEQDPLRFQARGDERVFVIGDAMGAVSPLFGHYPKSGHLASRQGRIVAHEIAARAGGAAPDAQLPESTCYVRTDFDPPQLLRIDARYRVRGDGLIAQTVRQHSDANPHGEDLQWAQSMFGEFLALPD